MGSEMCIRDRRNGADLGLVVADVPVIPLDDQLGVDLAKAEQGHPAAVLGDLDGGGAALEADGLRLLIRDVVASVLFGKAAPGHQLDVVAVLLADDALIVELVDGALDADNVVFQWFAHSFASLSVFINGDLVDEPALVLSEEEIGGLGEAVCAVLSEKQPTPVRRVGVQDVFGCSGPAWDLLKKFGLDAATICKTAHEMLGK